VGRRPVRITVEHTVDPAPFYGLYVAAFAPLRTTAAARHLLTADEFAAEMADPRIDKYVAWDNRGDTGGDAVALTTLTTDLAAVPWVSPEYFAARYPRHHARRAIYYLGYTLVHPDHEGEGLFARIAARLARRMTEERAVCAFDVCAHNDGVHGIGRRIAGLSRSLDMTLDTVDVQTYYAAAFNGPRTATAQV